MTQQRWLS